MSRSSFRKERLRGLGLVAMGLATIALFSSLAVSGLALGSTASSPLLIASLTTVANKHGGSLITGSTAFTMRGFNYMPLKLRKVVGKTRYYINETFQRSSYHPVQIAETMESWVSMKYNSVRVFVNQDQIGNSKGPGLDSHYVANVANFLTTAARDGIRTLLTIGPLPTTGGYTPKANGAFGLINDEYLDPAFITAENRYLKDFLTDLQHHGAPLADVMWELMDEQNWYNEAAPLSWTKGMVKTADGRTYNMASAASRVAMENDNLVHWTNALATTIHQLLPGSLVGVGVYPPSVKRPTYTVRPAVLFSSATKSDFVDIHVYPNLGPELTQVTSFHGENTHKPVVIGELGATRETPLVKATQSLVSWERLSCKMAGVSASGWLLWTWNSAADLEFYDAQMGNGLIGRTLSPVARPNPCV